MGKQLDAQPGWTTFVDAADELHAAELIAGDPLAPGRLALPHLRAFWTLIARAAVEAGLGAGDSPAAWLGAEVPGVDARQRQRLAAQLGGLEGQTTPADAELRKLLEDARALLATLEPQIGGVPLRSRKRRVLWTCVGLTLLFGPLLAYLALHVEIQGEGPWRAAYFTDRKLESKPIVQRERDVSHDWKKDAPLEAVPPDKFSVRWDTCLDLPEAGPLILQVTANDGARVFVDGETVIDAWERDPVSRRRGSGSAELELEAGVHHLRVEYFESLGTANIRLGASFDEELPEPIPAKLLRYPGDEIDDEDPCAAVK